jgi:hypothetical protein
MEAALNRLILSDEQWDYGDVPDGFVTLTDFTCLYSVLASHSLERFQPLSIARFTTETAYTCSM